MNKESIYKLIGYHGEYSDNVKKAIKKLLKENHPDHNGNEKIFKLINEVKKELETNQVSFDYINATNVVNNDDIDYNYCHEMIKQLDIERKHLLKKINKNNAELDEILQKYRVLYDNSLKQEDKIVNYNSLIKLKQVKRNCILLVILLIMWFIVYIITNNTSFFFIFLVCVFIAIIYIYNFFLHFQQLAHNNSKRINSYVNSIKDLRNALELKQKLLDEQNRLQKNLKSLENDLRFYHNLLKYK